jgi:hypothetical protein
MTRHITDYVVQELMEDEEGEVQSYRFHRKDGGFTIQHEVDHNLGILITDLQGR